VPQYHEIVVNGDGEVVSVRRDIPPPGMFPTAREVWTLLRVLYLTVGGASLIYVACMAFCWLFGLGL
jgi:hypothetical protein